MNRRVLFQSWRSWPLLVLLAGTPFAQAQPVYLVELANFACPHCAHMEALDPAITKAVAQTGGIFDFAPVPAEGQTTAPEKIYFAARLQGPAVAKETRNLLFEAMHQDGEPVQSVTQGIVFLQQDWPAHGPHIDYQTLTVQAESPPVLRSVEKAQMLGLQEGISRLPAFIFIQKGAPVAVIGRGPQYPSTPQIQTAVLAKIQQITAGSPSPQTTPKAQP